MPSFIIFLFLVVLCIGVAGYSTGDVLVDDLHEISGVAVESVPSSMPSFYTRQQLILGPALNVTVREGDKALMPCIAPHLGDKTVSWIRQKDLAILISGNHVYTSDTRVESIHPSASDLWGLQISPVRSSDEGFYQCQVNTEPKQSRTVVLVVLEQDLKDSPSIPAASSNTSAGRLSRMMTLKILGEQERTVVEGDSVNFKCSVFLFEDGLYGKNIELAWWRGNYKISSKIAGTRISSNQVVGATDVTVELHISSVKHSDSGTFHCKAEPKYFQHQTIKTFVLKESSVNLNVVRKHIQTSSSAFITMPLSIFSIVLISCSFMVL